MVDIVLSVACKVAEYLVAPVGRHCGYLIFSNSYAGQLKEELENLENSKQRMQHSIDEALNNMKLIEPDVEKWVTDVETIASKARNAPEHDGRVKKTCFCGWLPNPKERYCLGRDARKTVSTIQELIIQLDKFKRVCYENDPSALVGGAPGVNSSAGYGGVTITNSQASIFQGIMNALDDEKHKVIGIYGPGGVGKTTLLEEVEKKLRKEAKPFHMIVKAKVSQTPDVNDIQYQIADVLSLNLKDKQSQQGRRELLLERLKRDPNEKVLIILDDLWYQLDLKAIGIPWGDESRGCKLLLSSRFKDVLEQKMRADQTFHLEGLNEDEAFRLFEKTVGDKLKDDDDLKAKADQVVRKLAGLPLLIESVASTLKCSDVYTWENMLIKIEDPNTERIVKWSYDHLEREDAKSLFLLCGLMGGTIQVELLLGLGLGLGLFKPFVETIKDARNRLNAMLGSLRSVCLLQDSGNDMANVTIHDLYSEVVISTPFSGQNSLMTSSSCGSLPKEKLEKCWACLVNVGSDRLAQLMRRGFPDMMILMVSKERDMGDHDNLDFTYMKELRVLYLRSMHFTSLPSSIEILGNLQSLYLDHCDVEDVAILGKLKALQILSFVWSRISRLPREIGELTNLKSLNLSFCWKLEIIEPGVLKGLINLEELLMQGSFDRWMGEDEVRSESCNPMLAELKSLTKLTALEISIPDLTILLEAGDLPFGNLIRFWIEIGNVHSRRNYEGLTTMKLNLEGRDNILSKEWVQKTLHKTQYLFLEGLGGSKKNAHELCTQGFPRLKHLKIWNSPSIEYIIASSSGGIPPIDFPRLESLVLVNLINLEKICHRPVDPERLSKLKAVEIGGCNQLKYLWCLSQMPRFVQLEEIKVWECESIQALIAYDIGEDIADADHIVELPNLRSLDLRDLPRMTSFCIGAGIALEGAPIQGSFPHLESLEMEGESVLHSQPSLESSNLSGNKESGTTASDSQDDYSNSLFDRKVSLPSLEELKLRSVGSFKRIWPDELPTSSLCELASLILDDCSELLNVFPSTIIGRLNNLTSIWIERCPSLASLFDCGSLDSSTEQIIVLLPKLGEVTMRDAGKLRCMVESDSQMILGFPSLEDVLFQNCSSMKYLFPYLTAATLEKLKELEISYCEQMKEVVSKEEGDRSEADVMSFPSLTHVSINRCSDLRAFISSHTSVGRKLGETAEENDESPRPLFNEMVKLPNIKVLKIIGAQCKELWNNQSPDDSFCKLEFLGVEHCNKLQLMAPSHMWKRLQHHLEILQVKSCPEVKIIYQVDETATKSGKLRKLVLYNLQNLTHIWQSGGLPNLRFIEVLSCPRLRMLFPTFTAEFLGQIKELVVESCEDMELIAGREECEEATSTAITFSELTALRLFELPKFRSFLPEKYTVEFPSSLVLSRVSCGTEPNQGRDAWRRYNQRKRFDISEETWKYRLDY